MVLDDFLYTLVKICSFKKRVKLTFTPVAIFSKVAENMFSIFQTLLEKYPAAEWSPENSQEEHQLYLTFTHTQGH